MDAGDSDPASFFYYLGEAVYSLGTRRMSRLPLLTPEYREDLPGFARRFFRELYARLPRSAALVLDNCQDVEPGATFHELVAGSITEIPEGITLVMVSRRDPPNSYTRLLINERVNFLEWDDLQLTLEETRAIAAARMAVTEAQVSRLHAQCGGWVAGLTLLVDGERRQAASREPLPGHGHELIFNYFAGQIFAGLPKRVRAFLMATACLPQVLPSVAKELTGEAKSSEILRDLYQRHLFTHRRLGQEPTYWYHALFRSFLLTQAEHKLSQARRRSIRRKAGRLFERNEAFDEAYELYRTAEDWNAAAALVLRRADILVQQGRDEVLCTWIEGLPAYLRDLQPWLSYWLGAAMLPIAPTRARVQLEYAFASFSRLGDRRGRLEAAANIIQSYLYDWSDLLPLSRWMEVIAVLLTEVSADLPVALQLKAYSSMVIAMLYRHPDHPMLATSVEHVEALLDAGLNVEERLTAATFLVGYHTLTGDLRRAERIVARIEPLLDEAGIPPTKLVWWWSRVQFLQCRLGAYAEAQTSLRRGREVAEAHGLQSLRSLNVLVASFENELLANLGDLQRLQQNIERMASLIDYSVPMQVWWLEGDRDWFDLTSGKCSLEHVRATIDLAERSGGAYPRISSRIVYAHALCLNGDRQCLPGLLDEIRQMIAGTCFARWESELKLVQAFAMLCNDELSTFPETLRGAFSHCRQTRYCFAHRSTKGMLAALCAEALWLDIEVEYVREIIARYQLTAPATAGETWPWPVRVYTLGQFRVLVGDRHLSFSRKVPKKLVAVLKAIVSSGRNAMRSERLMDMIWPDEEGDAAYQALAKSVQRLRRLLGDDKAVALQDGKVTLDPAQVWVDAFALEGAAVSRHTTSQGHALQQSLELYRGAFMEGEEETSWILTARSRLRAKFVSLVRARGVQLESIPDWTGAVHCYTRALEIDTAAEEFRQCLRDCQAAANDVAAES